MLGVTAHRLAVLRDVCRHLDATLDQTNPTPLLDQWRRRAPMRSTVSCFENDGRVIAGEVIDIDPTQGLIVRTHDGSIVHLPAATTSVLDDDPRFP